MSLEYIDEIGSTLEDAKAVTVFLQPTPRSRPGSRSLSSEGTADQAIFEHIGATYDMANHASGAGEHMKAVPDDFIDRFAVVGPAGACVDQLGELISVGLDRLVLLTGSRDSDPAQTRASTARISTDVFPQLR